MPKLIASGLTREKFHEVKSQSSTFYENGLNIHFSRIEKSVNLNQGGAGGGLLSTNSNKKGETKKILKNISGEANAGEILAIMVRENSKIYWCLLSKLSLFLFFTF